jgi:hypothetical protein
MCAKACCLRNGCATVDWLCQSCAYDSYGRLPLWFVAAAVSPKRQPRRNTRIKAPLRGDLLKKRHGFRILSMLATMHIKSVRGRHGVGLERQREESGLHWCQRSFFLRSIEFIEYFKSLATRRSEASFILYEEDPNKFHDGPSATRCPQPDHTRVAHNDLVAKTRRALFATPPWCLFCI